jgi:hypothetical protein
MNIQANFESFSMNVLESEGTLPDLTFPVFIEERKSLPAVKLANGQRGRKRMQLPAISLGNGIMRRYEAEKIYGIRRSNGSRKLQRISNRHYEIILRHLSGESGEQIHNAMGLSISTISRVLNDPLCQAIIRQSYKDRQAELDALAGLAIGGVRDALTKGSTSEKLAAVDKYTKLKTTIASDSNPMESAEDFARAIVKNAQNVQINIGRR